MLPTRTPAVSSISVKRTPVASRTSRRCPSQAPRAAGSAIDQPTVPSTESERQNVAAGRVAARIAADVALERAARVGPLLAVSAARPARSRCSSRRSPVSSRSIARRSSRRRSGRRAPRRAAAPGSSCVVADDRNRREQQRPRAVAAQEPACRRQEAHARGGRSEHQPRLDGEHRRLRPGRSPTCPVSVGTRSEERVGPRRPRAACGRPGAGGPSAIATASRASSSEPIMNSASLVAPRRSDRRGWPSTSATVLLGRDAPAGRPVNASVTKNGCVR